MIYKFIQGKEQRIRVYSQNSILILKNAMDILTFNTVVEDEEHALWLTFTIDQNNFIDAGIVQYQLFENNEVKDYGTAQVVASLLIDPNQDLRSRYAIIVEAIEKTLAGIATKGQKRLQVGDKSIDSYSAQELMELLNYFKGKLAEEEAGNDVNPKTDQMKILYKWSIR